MTDKETSLTHVNNQLKELIDLLQKEGDSSFSMKSFDQLLKKKTIHSTKKKWLILCSIFFAFLSIYGILCNDELTYNIYFVLLSFIRLILTKILPYWDWTKIYTNPCLLTNPFYNTSLDLSECLKCANITTVIRQSNITFFNFTKSIYLNHLPVIIDDATQTWSAMTDLSTTELFRLFVKDPVLSEQDLCYFESNIRAYNQPGGADRLFNDYLNGQRRSFVVQWNNCKRETLKVIRSYYSKPYFLPPSVGQTFMGNWLLVSAGSNKRTHRFYKIPLNYNWIWLAQIQGSSLIELQPKHPCEKMCSILKSIQLNKGDLIIYSRLYDARYSPLHKETILLGQGVD